MGGFEEEDDNDDDDNDDDDNDDDDDDDQATHLSVSFPALLIPVLFHALPPASSSPLSSSPALTRASCEEWVVKEKGEEEHGSRFVLHYHRQGGYPVRLTEYSRLLGGKSSTSGASASTELTKLMSYTFRKVIVGDIPASVYELPGTPTECERHAGGFPYFHAVGFEQSESQT